MTIPAIPRTPIAPHTDVFRFFGCSSVLHFASLNDEESRALQPVFFAIARHALTCYCPCRVQLSVTAAPAPLASVAHLQMSRWIFTVRMLWVGTDCSRPLHMNRQQTMEIARRGLSGKFHRWVPDTWDTSAVSTRSLLGSSRDTCPHDRRGRSRRTWEHPCTQHTARPQMALPTPPT